MEQAFKTAGRKFEVIQEDHAVQAIVEYGGAPKILDKLQEEKLSLKDQKQEIRKLQRYTVGISNQMYEEMNSVITTIILGKEEKILIWPQGYYSLEFGVTEEPVSMGLLDY